MCITDYGMAQQVVCKKAALSSYHRHLCVFAVFPLSH